VRSEKRENYYAQEANRDAKNLQEREKFSRDEDMQARKKHNR
jgi:hypothetical protein